MKNKRSFAIWRKQLRTKLVSFSLKNSGFKIIRDHWVYDKKLTGNSVVVDLGANKGDFSEYMFKYYNIRSFAFEPNNELFNGLNADHFNKYEFAVSDKDGPITFFISDNPEASSLINDFQELWSVNKKSVVNGLSWRGLLSETGINASTVDLLKIDIEGGEISLLGSLTSEALEKIDQLTVEFHHHLNKDLLNDTKRVIRKIMGQGYETIYSDISPTEILFIRKSVMNFSFFEKRFFSLYKKLSFSIFES